MTLSADGDLCARCFSKAVRVSGLKERKKGKFVPARDVCRISETELAAISF